MKNKIVSIILAGAMTLAGVIPFTCVSYAAPPSVSVDEAVYVNLDYYGGISNVSIVKSCDLNGNSTFTDYGSYQSVTNMSGYDEPALSTDCVKWDLSDIKNHQRFYFNGTLKKNAIEFPWTFDLSYKLNGVPCEANTLAGVSGLVEINIKFTPNDNAKEYHKNNMLLQVGTYVDLDDTYSLDAPGSQLQSIGSKKAVMFSALPGEENTFTIRIGTDRFENEGITIMMMPGTLDQFKDIKKLKEAKDTLEDSSNAMYISLNEVLKTIESMNSGLADLKSGTLGMEAARSTFSSGKDQLYDDFDDMIEDFTAVNNQLENMIPYFESGQRMIRSINNDIDDITDTLEELEDPLNDTEDSITVMQGDLTSLKSMLATLNSQMGTMLTNLSAVAASGSATAYEITELQGQAAMAATLSSYMAEINSLLTETVEMGETTKDIIGITNNLIDETEDAGDTFNRYEDDLIDLLEDSEQLTALLNSSMSSTIVCLSYSKSLMQQTGAALDPAMEQSLRGMTDLIDKSLKNMDDIASLRKVNTTVKNTVDEQFNKFEEENKFLNLDADANLQSFTSDRNPPPSTIQVILKTPEISLDSIDNDNIDIEKAKSETGILSRILKIFTEVWDRITKMI